MQIVYLKRPFIIPSNQLTLMSQLSFTRSNCGWFDWGHLSAEWDHFIGIHTC